MKELARRQNGSVTMRVNVEWPFVPLERMVHEADLIVRGRITADVSRLADDESFVYTDYNVAPRELVKQPADLTLAPRPGQAPPITLRELGGVVTVDGLRLRTQTDSDDEEHVVAGGEYLFIRRRVSGQLARAARTSPSAFEAAAGPFAVLRIENGKVVGLNKFVASRRPLATDDPEQLIAHIRQMVTTGR